MCHSSHRGGGGVGAWSKRMPGEGMVCLVIGGWVSGQRDWLFGQRGWKGVGCLAPPEQAGIHPPPTILVFKTVNSVRKSPDSLNVLRQIY